MAAQGVCSILRCGKPITNSRGWCPAHYQRWRKRGSPDADVPLGTSPGTRARHLFDVVLKYEGNECLIWPYSGVRGYGEVTVAGRRHLVHRFVCEEFHGPAPSQIHEAAHICGNGSLGCCTKRHLEWKTPVENQADRLLHGTHNRGERQGRSKLSREDVAEIRRLRGIVSQENLGRRFGVSHSHISRVQRGHFWGWLDESAQITDIK